MGILKLLCLIYRDTNVIYYLQMEALFEERLRRVRGFHIKAVRGDGACLFRAVGSSFCFTKKK